MKSNKKLITTLIILIAVAGAIFLVYTSDSYRSNKVSRLIKSLEASSPLTATTLPEKMPDDFSISFNREEAMILYEANIILSQKESSYVYEYEKGDEVTKKTHNISISPKSLNSLYQYLRAIGFDNGKTIDLSEDKIRYDAGSTTITLTYTKADSEVSHQMSSGAVTQIAEESREIWKDANALFITIMDIYN